MPPFLTNRLNYIDSSVNLEGGKNNIYQFKHTCYMRFEVLIQLESRSWSSIYIPSMYQP
jgi:hypothetical protein